MGRSEIDGILWRRMEKDGWMTVMPLEGNRAADSTMINKTARRVMELLIDHKLKPNRVIKYFIKQYPDASPFVIRRDIATVIMNLNDMELCDIEQKEIEKMLGEMVLNRGNFYIMDEMDVRPVADFCRMAYENKNGCKYIHTMNEMNEESLKPYVIRAMHVGGMNAMFIHTNIRKEIDVCISLLDSTFTTPVCTIGAIVAETHKDNTIDHISDALGKVELFVFNELKSTKVRFILPSCSANDGQHPISNNFFDWDILARVLGECKYREEALLKNEVAIGKDITFYSKNCVD